MTLIYLYRQMRAPTHACRHDYVPTWTLPGNSVKRLKDLFDPKKAAAHAEARKFKCSASEALALYPILRRWVRTGPMRHGGHELPCQAFLDMCTVVDLLQAAQKTVPVDPQDLLQAVERALAAVHAAGWQANVVKKFHWLLHFGDTLRRLGTLPACWVLERKHRLVTRYATPVQNTRNFERSGLEEAIAHDLAALRATGLFAGRCQLARPHPCSKRMRACLAEALGEACPAECSCSSEARLVSGQMCRVRDVVLLGNGQAGMVAAHVLLRDEPYTWLCTGCNSTHMRRISKALTGTCAMRARSCRPRRFASVSPSAEG